MRTTKFTRYYMGCVGRRASTILKRKPRIRRPVEDRFWEKVSKTSGCWLWTGARDPNGYGRFNWNRQIKTEGAPRASWMLTNGPIPDGLDVCHKCDNPACVRPDHLFLGTRSDNVQDMLAKGRNISQIEAIRGDKNALAVFTESDVKQIRKLSSSMSDHAIARKYGSSCSAVRCIRKRITWKHVA